MKKLFTLILALLLLLVLVPNVFAETEDYGDCQDEDGNDLGKHNFVLVGGKAPTCTDEGKQIYQCTKCGTQYPVYSDRLSETGEHTYVSKVRDGKNCDSPQIRYDECTVCGDIANEVSFGEPKGHTYVKDYNKEATCTENGFVYYVCSTCGYYNPEPDILPKTGHNYEETERVNSTCTKTGHVTYACTYCGIPYTKYLWATGHNYELSFTKKATCTEDGYITYTCSNCDESYDTPLSATGHDYQEVTKEATCTEDGYSYKECTKCGNKIDETTIKALGHDYSGNRYTCSRCGEKIEIQITFSKANITKAPEEEKKEEEQKEEEKQEEPEVIVIISYDDEEEEEKPLTRGSIQEDCPHKNIAVTTQPGSAYDEEKYSEVVGHKDYTCNDCGKKWTHYYDVTRKGCVYTAVCKSPGCGKTLNYTLHDHITSAAHYTGKKSVKMVNGKAQTVYEVEVYRYCTTCNEKTESITWYVSSKDTWTNEWSVAARNLYRMKDEYPEFEADWPQEVRRFIKNSQAQSTRN